MRHTLPDYEKPPVVEVVYGVLFKPLESLLAPHLGLLWTRLGPEYAKCEEVPPIPQVIERFEEADEPEIQVTNVAPLARAWFIHSDDTAVIQVQRDRFLCNWRKIRAENPYPRYETLVGCFKERLGQFESFLEETALGRVEPLQYELTYINHIPHGEGWDTLGDLGKVLNDFCWREDATRFLPAPDSINLRTSFVLPNRDGRLHVSVRNATRKKDRVATVLVELTARGIPTERSREAMWSWFDLAREWIVRGFADLTAADLQTKAWGRRS